MKTQKERGREKGPIEYFQLRDLIQALAKIFAFEITNILVPAGGLNCNSFAY